MELWGLLLASGTLILGLGAGLVFGYRLGAQRAKDAQAIASDLLKQKEEESAALVEHLHNKFDALALEALGKSTEQFMHLAQEKLGQQTQANEQKLEGKKTLIDQTLQQMKAELTKVQTMVQTVEKDRKAKFDVLSDQLGKAASETRRLTETTNTLQAALANSAVRGQWGERMAEDVLRLAGFVEGINYQKQQTLNGDEQTSRPDYTFYLPQNRVVHMDVKFPLANYLTFLEATSEAEKQQALKGFLADARKRVKEAAKRGYAAGNETLDYVLVFIPNEQVYAFLQEQDRALLDDALSQKVILCSPMTLYAILAVIRQAVDNFHMERTAGEILDLLDTFYAQWDKFKDVMEKMGKSLDQAQNNFHQLTTTRTNMLEKPLRKIEELQQEDKRLTSTGKPLHIIHNEKKEG